MYLSHQERRTGVTPDIKYLKVFGCAAWWHVPKEVRQPEKKLAPRGKKCIFLEIERFNNYRILDLESGKVVVSMDLTFDESGFTGYSLESSDDYDNGSDYYDDDGDAVTESGNSLSSLDDSDGDNDELDHSDCSHSSAEDDGYDTDTTYTDIPVLACSENGSDAGTPTRKVAVRAMGRTSRLMTCLLRTGTIIPLLERAYAASDFKRSPRASSLPRAPRLVQDP